MKRFLNRILRTYNFILTATIAVLGFSVSCESNLKSEYGTPNAKFIVNGKVESSLNNSPIRNIRVIIQNDTTFTDESGNYSAFDRNFPASQTFDISFHDIDSTENGAFVNKDTTVAFINPKFTKGDGHWYNGETSTELNVKLNSEK